MFKVWSISFSYRREVLQVIFSIEDMMYFGMSVIAVPACIDSRNDKRKKNQPNL